MDKCGASLRCDYGVLWGREGRGGERHGEGADSGEEKEIIYYRRRYIATKGDIAPTLIQKLCGVPVRVCCLWETVP